MVMIQRYSKTSNGMGGYIEEWTDYLPYEGVIDQLSGNEVISANQLAPSSTHILIGAYVEGIKESDRVSFDGKVYDIKNIDNPMNLNRHLEILLEFKGVLQDG
jgi:SPP1 family predicted phage head-tail adaptor